jgi:hypothetical protein
VEEYYLFKDHELLFTQDNVADGAVIAHNINFMLVVFPVKDKARNRNRLGKCIDALSQENIIVGFSNRKSLLNSLYWPILLINDDTLALFLLDYNVGQRFLLNGLGSSFVSGHIHSRFIHHHTLRQ